jgi:hypothetical protein
MSPKVVENLSVLLIIGAILFWLWRSRRQVPNSVLKDQKTIPLSEKERLQIWENRADNHYGRDSEEFLSMNVKGVKVKSELLEHIKKLNGMTPEEKLEYYKKRAQENPHPTLQSLEK